MNLQNFGDGESPDGFVSKEELIEKNEIVKRLEDDHIALKISNTKLQEKLTQLKSKNTNLTEELQARRVKELELARFDKARERYEQQLIEKFPSNWSEIEPKMTILIEDLTKIASKHPQRPEDMVILSKDHILEICNTPEYTNFSLFPLKPNAAEALRNSGNHKNMIADMQEKAASNPYDYRDYSSREQAITFQWVEGDGLTGVYGQGFCLANQNGMAFLQFRVNDDKVVAKPIGTRVEASIPPGNLLLRELISMLKAVGKQDLLDKINLNSLTIIPQNRN